MNTNHQKIDWNAPNVLMQIINTIQVPLSSIIDANNQSANNRGLQKSSNTPKEIIFSSSQEISDLIEEVLKEVSSKPTPLFEITQPAIFEIYEKNEHIQSLCKQRMNPNTISKSDWNWLLNFEKEVFKKIKSNQLNLFDLSYDLAISERQLHRKIKNLLCLTPNRYIRILKLHKAKELLDDFVYDTIAEVSYTVGYFDTHYFSKLFLQQYGISPRELLLSNR